MTDLLVFGLKPLKLSGSTNGCKFVNFFGAFLIYNRTKPKLLNRCPVCFYVFIYLFILLNLPSCLCDFWVFGNDFYDIRVEELS